MKSVSFTSGSLSKSLLMFSLPLIAANILQYSYQFADMAIAGTILGETALVAISNASSVAFVINSLVIGLTAGGGVAIARAVGAGDVLEQRRSFAATLIVSLAAATLVGVVGCAGSRSMFTAMSIPTEALDDASAYIVIVSAGSFCSFLLNAANAFFKSQGRGVLPFVFVGVSAVCNVALGFVFVAVLGFGVPGAAWATVISQGAAAAAALVSIRARYEAGRDMAFASKSGIGVAMMGVLRVGLPSAIQTAVINLSYVLVTGLLNTYGSDIAAAAGIGLKVSTLAGLPCWAIGSAITTASAQCFGAKKLDRAYRCVKAGLGFNIGVIVAVQIVIQIFAVQFVCLLGASSPEVIDVAVCYLRITCSANGVFYAALYSFDSFALGAGSPKLVLANSLIDAFAGRFGLALLFSGVLLPELDWGYIGVFAAQAMAPVLPAFIGGIYVLIWARKRTFATWQKVRTSGAG